MDKFSTTKRSEIMAQIRAKDTKPEKIVRSLLHKMGFRFRIHRSDLPGTPDIVLPRHKTIIFVHGCFWHFHEGCKEAILPKTNTEYWREKLYKNIKRDQINNQELEKIGWNVLEIWECEIQDLRILSTKIKENIKI
ncbi:MAG TPA: very short patch repair endonuclease [Desulfobulbaceae bacterium]|nr:very short patch repair endonuclease [Desulfobulbaceae bacterium]